MKSAISICGFRNDLGNTALQEAAEGGQPDIIMVLLKYKQRAANVRNKSGETALLLACKFGHVEAAKLLWEATASPWVVWPSSKRQTCLHVAAYGGHLAVVKSILANLGNPNTILKCIIFIPDADGATPLHSAVHGGHIDIVHEFVNTDWIDKRLMMRKKDKFGRCPIHVALTKGRWDIVEVFLLSIPECVNIRSVNLKTSIHFAVEHNQFQIVQNLLLDKNPEKVYKLVSCDCDILGNTSLHLGVMNEVDPELVRYLLSFPDVNVNAVNNEGLTAIDIASAQDKPNYAKIVEILKDAGATQSFIRHSKSSPWDSKISAEQEKGGESKIMDVDTVVASLIATITFAAIFQVPGGLEDDKGSVQYGAAKFALDGLFQAFLFSDILAFSMSVVVVLSWIFHQRLLTDQPRPRHDLSAVGLVLSIVCTVIAFICATVLVTIPRDVKDLKSHDKKVFQDYYLLFLGEYVAASLPPFVSVVITLTVYTLSWYQYYIKAGMQLIPLKYSLILTGCFFIVYGGIIPIVFYMEKVAFNDLIVHETL